LILRDMINLSDVFPGMVELVQSPEFRKVSDDLSKLEELFGLKDKNKTYKSMDYVEPMLKEMIDSAFPEVIPRFKN